MSESLRCRNCFQTMPAKWTAPQFTYALLGYELDGCWGREIVELARKNPNANVPEFVSTVVEKQWIHRSVPDKLLADVPTHCISCAYGEIISFRADGSLPRPFIPAPSWVYAIPSADEEQEQEISDELPPAQKPTAGQTVEELAAQILSVRRKAVGAMCREIGGTLDEQTIDILAKDFSACRVCGGSGGVYVNRSSRIISPGGPTFTRDTGFRGRQECHTCGGTGTRTFDVQTVRQLIKYSESVKKGIIPHKCPWCNRAAISAKNCRYCMKPMPK